MDDRHDSLLVEGDDTDNVLPPAGPDPFTPEPAPPNGKARVALAAALVILLVLVALAVYGLAR